MPQVGGWSCSIFSLVFAIGCGGRAAGSSPDREQPDTGQEVGGAAVGGAAAAGATGVGGAATAGAAALAGSAPGGAGPTPLLPQVGAPSPVSDGRLPDLPETRVGEPSIGWDTCSSGLLVSRRECVACPAARGMEFLIVDAAPPAEPVDPQRPQFYFYFEEPQSSAALWIDFAWLSGPRSALLSLWETNTVCDPQGEPQLFDLAPLLLGPPGAWSSACIPLDESRKLQGLGFRISTAGRVGVDAIRFGPPCRLPR